MCRMHTPSIFTRRALEAEQHHGYGSKDVLYDRFYRPQNVWHASGPSCEGPDIAMLTREREPIYMYILPLSRVNITILDDL